MASDVLEKGRGTEAKAMGITSGGDRHIDGWLVGRLAVAILILATAACSPASLASAQSPTGSDAEVSPVASPARSPSPSPTPSGPEVLPSGAASLAPGFEPGQWALDPAYPPPTGASTELHILVWYRACAGFTSTKGRMAAPVIAYEATTITITIGLRPLSGVQTCPLPPGTPAVVVITEPLADRALLDGGRSPVSPPTAP